jgi:hypothetical protein
MYPASVVILFTAFFIAFITPCPRAQGVETLRYTIPSPPTGVQTGTEFGSSVATNGGLVVVGTPQARVGGPRGGSAEIFDSITGKLRYSLVNPDPVNGDAFGNSVSFSGNLAVVAAPGDMAGAGSVYVFDVGSPNPPAPAFVLHNPIPAGKTSFGLSVAISGRRLVATDFGHAFVYDLDSAAPTVPLISLDDSGPGSPGVNSNYGYAVAIDGSRVVVGAVRRSDYFGVVYVYDLGRAEPTIPISILENLNAPPGAAGSTERFGRALSISGSKVAVGAFGAGKVFVFDLDGQAPSVPAFVRDGAGLVTNATFGSSIVISGTKVAVGAPSVSVDSGGVCVFDLASSEPTEPLVLRNPTPDGIDEFGYSVALSGSQLVTGAPNDSNPTPMGGSVYVYDLAAASPSVPVATLNRTFLQTGGLFGTAVALESRYLAVGAPDFPHAEGSVLVYDLQSSAHASPVITLYRPAESNFGVFGRALAMSGSRLLVGAPYLYGEGSAHLYDLESNGPAASATTLEKLAPGANFGYSVAISREWAAVAQFSADTDSRDIGLVQVYRLSKKEPPAPWLALTIPRSPLDNNYFGAAMAISGSRIVVGAPRDSRVARYTGSAFVYDLSGANPAVPVASLRSPNPAAEDYFGTAVSISGSKVIVGAFGDDSGALNGGAAFVFDLEGQNPEAPKLTLRNSVALANFGVSTVISGSLVAVGASQISQYPGTVDIYYLLSPTPDVPTATLTNPPLYAGGIFGKSLAIKDKMIAVGAPYIDSIAVDTGGVYIFGPALTPLEAWRQKNFGTPNNAGLAADTADPDNDGLSNFVEWAFGQNPNLRDSSNLPQWRYFQNKLSVDFEVPTGVVDVLYSAEQSNDLSSGWVAIPDSGSPPNHHFELPADDSRVFVRLRATGR